MGHCTQCGKEVKAGQGFCTHCGATVVPQPNSPPTQRSKTQSSHFFQTKKFKILAVLAVVIIAALFTSYKIIDSRNHPSKIVQQFEKAIEAKDSKQLAQVLNSGQDKMKVNEKDAKLLLNYFADHPDYRADTIEKLRNEANALKKETMISRKKNSDVFLSVVESEKKWLLFTQYGLSFEPVYFVVSADEAKVSVTINDKKQGDIDAGEEKTFGPFLPVEHEIVASYKGTYGSATVTEKVDPLDHDSHKIDVELDLTEHHISLYSNYNDAIVFINGKSTGKTVEELDSFGPVATDGSIKIHAEITVQGHTLKSETVTVTEVGQEIELYIDDAPIREAKAREAEAKAQREQAEEEIKDVIYSHYNYISYGNFSDAYDLFSSGRKKKVDYSSWAEGLMYNISNSVKKVTVDSVDGTSATASFEMVSRDFNEDGTLVQTWSGKWHLVKEYSGWKLNDPNIKKIDSRIE